MNDLRTASEPSMSALVSGIIRDTQTLIKQEMALAKHEVKDEVHKTVQAGVSLSVGVGLVAVGAGLLLLMLVHLLNWAIPAMPSWGGYGIVGGIVLLVGVGLLLFARSKAEDIHLQLPQTTETLKENAQWIQNQT